MTTMGIAEQLDATAARLGRLPKAPTGISGLDEVTGGGLPRGGRRWSAARPAAARRCSAMEFLVRGITQFDEPGVFVAFEESADDLDRQRRVAGLRPRQLEADGQLVIDHVDVVGGEIEETGDWDLEGCSSASARPSTRSAPSGS